MIETIMITEENQMNLAERFGVEEDFDEMLPIGLILLTDIGDNFDYDLIEYSNN